MFNSIYGKVSAKKTQTLMLETGSEETGIIEWCFSVSDSSLDVFPNVGEKARVYAWLQHKDDNMNLFGFASERERDTFFDLLKVDGVGPKLALKILSNITASNLAVVLDDGDLARLEKIPGIGKKTAQKMLLALKGKLTFQEDTVRIAVKNLSPWQDVISALCSMGYDKREVEPLIIRLSDELDSNLSRKEQEDALFRRAIVELAN
jgi:Holliday junction DNA helicase RuvA